MNTNTNHKNPAGLTGRAQRRAIQFSRGVPQPGRSRIRRSAAVRGVRRAHKAA